MNTLEKREQIGREFFKELGNRESKYSQDDIVKLVAMSRFAPEDFLACASAYGIDIGDVSDEMIETFRKNM